MIHDTCPCCEVTRAPHEDDCTFADDCPDACATFDYVAELRAELDAALAEVERHRMTEDERGAVAFTLSALAWPLSADQMAVAAKSLGPSFVAPEHPKRLLIGNYLDRTKEGE